MEAFENLQIMTRINLDENLDDNLLDDTLEFNEVKYLYSWGFGKYGQIGLKFGNYSLTPIKQNIEEKEEIFLISGGESHSAILTFSSKLFMYGKNYFGQLGLNHSNYVYFPTKIDFSVKISKVVCGGDHTLAISEENNVYTWGLNVFGQLGLGDFLARKQPVKVDLLIPNENNEPTLYKNEEVVDISAGAQHSMLLTSKNRILTCGYAKYFALGYETEEDVNYFKAVNNGAPNNTNGICFKSCINKIACGVIHSGCIVDNEVVYIWGKGDIIQYEKPTAISLISDNINLNTASSLSPGKKQNQNLIRDFKIGEDNVYILNKNDEVFAMGDNKHGQLGDKTQNSRKTLEKIETPKIKQIEVGYSHAMMVTFDNKIYGWGSNDYGQLGLSTSNLILQPTYLEELSSLGVFKIACGGYHSLGLFNTNVVSSTPFQDTNLSAEFKKNLKICNLNSTIKKDYLHISEKYKYIENMKKRITELESSVIVKDNLLKDLKMKEEELNKRLDDGGKDVKKSIYAGMNPRGFDNNFEINLEELEFSNEEAEIGRGTFGDVRKGIWRKEQVAVKFLKQEMTTSEDNINAFIEECNMLKNLRHPNILLFMGVCTTPPIYFIVTEFCENGNLFELLHQHKNITLNWEEKRRIALEIALGMNYLHSFEPPILHRDLKSMNVLLDKNFQVKIADFGSTKFLEVQMTKQKGTFQWMAPEVIKGNSYTEKADVFSFAIIMNELASRTPPYYGVDKKEVARNVATKPDYRPGISRSYPKDYSELMIKCWDHNALKRPTFSDVIDALIKMKFTL